MSTPSPCPCGPPEDPQVVSNPPDLAQISYRVGDFTGFRRALLRPLPGEQAIGAWQPAPGDLGLQVLEWWAYLADVLTFYNERIANESYLRTATQQASIANLAALLGYAPAPGIAATGMLAVTRSASHPGEPLVIPAGMPVSSSATPGVPSQTFETGQAASFTGPSGIPVTLPPDTALQAGPDGTPASVLLAGRVSGLSAGDQLLLAETGFGGQGGNWALVTVGGVTPATDPGTGAASTLVTFSAAARGPAPAPALPGPCTGYQLLRPAAAAALWNLGPPAGMTVVAQNGPGLTVQLAAAVSGITPGDMVLFDCGPGSPPALANVTAAAQVLWTVPFPPAGTAPGGTAPGGTAPGSTAPGSTAPGSTAPGSTAPGSPPGVVVTHTALTVATADAAALLQADPATVTARYGFRAAGTIIGVPAATLAALPATVAVPAGAPLPLAGTAAFLQDATGAGVLVTIGGAGPDQVVLTGAGTPPATIGTPLQVPLQVLPDVVPVSRGTTVTGEVLGSGNAALAGQSFTLATSPLTYLASGTGPVSTLSVYVNGVQWQEVPSFYDQPPGARVFVVSRSADQTVTTVTFGDGINGARLTSGTGNVTASYRYGSGAASPPAGRLTTITQPQPNLASVCNPVAVSGGADPEPPVSIRASAPASVRTFGRAISVTDYEIIAGQAPGVSRTSACWAFNPAGGRALVTLYVDGGQGAAAAASAALAGAGAGPGQSQPVVVLPATPVELSLSCTLAVAAGQLGSAVAAAATAAVCDPAAGLFSPAAMGIGQLLYRSAVDAALMVPGVTAVRGLTVSPAGQPPLGQVLDPGADGYFDLPPGNVTITWEAAGG